MSKLWTPESVQDRAPVVSREQEIEAMQVFFLAGSFILDTTIDAVNTVTFARDEIENGDHGFAQSLVTAEVEVPSHLKGFVDQSFVRERYSYRMSVGSGIIAATVDKDSAVITRYGTMSVTNTKANKGKFRQCSEPGAEDLALEHGYNYIPALILVSDPEKAATVEGIHSSLVLPCEKTCVNETFEHSRAFPEDTLILASDLNTTMTQIFSIAELRDRYRQLAEGGEVQRQAHDALHVDYGAVDFDYAHELFDAMLDKPASESHSVTNIAMLALKRSTRAAEASGAQSVTSEAA